MKSVYIKNVRLNHIYSPTSGGRVGTVNLSAHDFYKRFGDPHVLGDINILHNTKKETYEDQKVSIIWTFRTPRGLFEVRDYWWNGPDELSIAANSKKAVKWAKSYLKAMDIPIDQGV